MQHIPQGGLFDDQNFQRGSNQKWLILCFDSEVSRRVTRRYQDVS